jgi:two-component system chemotaxis response regulator CheY
MLNIPLTALTFFMVGIMLVLTRKIGGLSAKHFIAQQKDILTKNGYEIAAEAENGQKAVEKYPEAKPDLVLMDITMPEMDGIEALKKIKALDPGAKIIMCSAMGQQAMVIEAIQAGAKDFIVKPFQAERVLEAVKKVVG